MKIQTSRFGEVEVSEDSLFSFVSPIIGYQEEKEFALIEHKESSSFKWLQSTKTPNLAFLVAIAGIFGIDYSFELPETTQEELGIETAGDVLALNIVVIPHANPRASTINLLAPLVFNVNNHKGSQIILTGTNFSVTYPLFKEEAVC